MISVTPASLQFKRKIWSRHLVTLILYVLYLAVGMLFYQMVEGWNTLDTIYFAHVTMSTVGYGDVAPTTPGSQAFTIFYIFVGILAVFTRISSLVTGFTRPLFNFSRKVMDKIFPDETIDIDGDGSRWSGGGYTKEKWRASVR